MVESSGKHSEPRASFAGARRWMKAVAMMTPEPKYFAMKKAVLGTCMRLDLASTMGTTAPRRLPIKMTKMELMRRPRRPSYSLPVSTGAEGSARFGPRLLGRTMHESEGLYNLGRVGEGRLTAINRYGATRIFGRHGELRRGLVGHGSEVWLIRSAGKVEVDVEVEMKVRMRGGRTSIKFE